ncbi:hypothetical protein [Nocardia sp. NPDC046763]|uniref:hypothetical protein n=1 Tax=Nocardia sp. NPDC046763 TaxID=3155256 RepID=UPI0033EB1014
MVDQSSILDGQTELAAEALDRATLHGRAWTYRQPLCDIFAQNHSWADARSYLIDPRLRLRVAHARALRGEDLTRVDLRSEEPSDREPEEAGHWSVPLQLQPWESRHWDAVWLTRHHDWGSQGPSSCFPLNDHPLPIPLSANVFDGLVGTVESLGDYELSGWIRSVPIVLGTAEQAIAHHLEVGGCGHSKSTVPAAVVEFANAYPSLVRVFGGAGAYGTVSESLGRLRVWRLLSVMIGSTSVAEINDLVDRTRCVAWQDPCDEIWYLHLALEDPLQGLTWVLDGQSFD